MYLLSLYLCRYLEILCLIVFFLKIIKINDVVVIKSSIVRMIKVMMEFFELVRFVVFLIVLFL